MDSARVQLLREVLANTGWVDRTRGFARSLRRSTDTGDGLLLVGTPTHEPWHLAAHLDDEARITGITTLSPTLVRWSPPLGAPAHLSIGLDRLEGARRGETLFVVAPDDPTEGLLERLADARRSGATLLTIDNGTSELGGLAHDQLIVPERALITPAQSTMALVSATTLGLTDIDFTLPDMSFDTVQHLVSAAAGDTFDSSASAKQPRPGLRDRLARLLDGIQGAPPSREW